MSEFRPITTLPDLFLQDDEEMAAGYWSGQRGDPEPGNLYSRAYWHGWRNGMADTNRRKRDAAQIELHALLTSRMLRCPSLQ